MLAFQRQFGHQRGAVLDGRDIGTVIFPEARAKLFVTASVAARAARRFKELRARGADVTLQDVTDDLQARDAADVARAAAPLAAGGRRRCAWTPPISTLMRHSPGPWRLLPQRARAAPA
ncbi:MAG: (d)CMP kinase [Rhodospirillales bacterium]